VKYSKTRGKTFSNVIPLLTSIPLIDKSPIHTPIYTYIRVGIISRRCRQCRILDRRFVLAQSGSFIYLCRELGERVRCVVIINQGHSRTFKHTHTHIHTYMLTRYRRYRSKTVRFVVGGDPSFLRRANLFVSSFFCTSPAGRILDEYTFRCPECEGVLEATHSRS